METARSRGLTDKTQRITYRASGLSFRAYNELYEKWLDHRYSSKITPHTNHPSVAYDAYLTTYAHETRNNTDNSICALVRELDELRKTPGLVAQLAYRWRDMGQKKREEIVLDIWEKACKRSEQGNYTWMREDCPELTLAYATSLDENGVGTWIRMWETQGQTEEEKRKSIEDPDVLPYHNIRNKKWDRVNGVLDLEASALPVKKSVRAFVHDGIAGRNHQLRQFIEAVYVEVSGVKVADAMPAKRAAKNTTITSEEKEMLLRLNAQGIGITANERTVEYEARCTYCQESPEVSPPKMICTICKSKANRIVRYCSSECFHKDHRHRNVCGAPLTTSGAVPSFSPSSVSTSPRDTSSLESPPAPSSSESSFPALSLRTLSRYPPADRSAWFHLLNNNPGSYWVACQGQPEDYDPRKRLNATPVDLPFSFENRYETRHAMRSVAFDFINREDESAVDLVLAFLHAENLGPEKEEELTRQVRWIAKLMGKEGDDINEFVQSEFPQRLTRGLLEIKNNEKYRLIRLYFGWKEAIRLGPDTGEVEYCTIVSLIAFDLNQDPEAIWYTCHPSYPEKNITQVAMRITGPDLAFETKNKDSKFAHTKDRLILTRALRRHILGVLERPGEDLDSLGLLMLSIADPRLDSDRAYQWMLRRTSLDLGLPEELLVREMERMRLEVQLREGEEWDKIREALEIIASQGSTMPPDAFPPLSITSSIPRTPLDAATTRLTIPSNDSSSPTDPAATSSDTTKKKNKKKKKKKKSKKTGEKPCESAGDGTGLLDANQEAVE